MGHKNLAYVALVILLVASLSVCAADVSSARSIEAASPPGLPAAGTDSYGVQAIAQAVPTWQQVNTSGFGDPRELEVSALEAFNGYLYAGTYNIVDPLTLFDGARIYRSPDGVTWSPVTQPGFQNAHDTAPPAILDFVVFGNRLYASTGRGGNPGQIWRASNGVSWAPMVAAGFGDPDLHDIAALAVYNSVIYAGASSQVSGARIFRSSSGDSNTWTPVAPAAPTMAGSGVTGFAVFNNALYAIVESEAPVQIWRSTGGAWTTVMSNGFGDSNTIKTGGMTVFGGYLYVGAGNAVHGAQLWRSNNGTSWAQAIQPGFGDSNNKTVEMVFIFQNQLYAGVQNAVTGIEVWRSADGTLWEQVNQDGFGDSNNTTSNRSNATAEFLSQLYVGTSNHMDGGELWRMLQGLNNPPTDIVLSNTTVDENQPVNTVVGALTAADPDAGATFTFSLACATAGVDDGSFNILGTNLRTSAVFNFEMKSAYHICIRVTDQGGLYFDKSFVVTVINATFADVPSAHWAWQYIERLYNAGITGGCATTPLSYCPENSVTRAQMAVFLERGVHFPNAFTPSNVSPTFTDTVGHWAEDWIEALRSDGITGGCGTNLYCPDSPVTRAQMAVFLLKSRHGLDYTPAPATGTKFADVASNYWAAAWIEQLANEGITGGCGNNNYCPENPVTRAQMAVFLVKTFNLP